MNVVIARDPTEVGKLDAALEAERFAVFRAIGHRAALLDGGLAAWDGPLEAGPGHARAAVPFTAVPWPLDRVASLEQAADDRTLLIDARARIRYRLAPSRPRW